MKRETIYRINVETNGSFPSFKEIIFCSTKGEVQNEINDLKNIGGYDEEDIQVSELSLPMDKKEIVIFLNRLMQEIEEERNE